MDLQQCRDTINRIDSQLLKLFEQRMNQAIEIAKYKHAHQLPVLVLSREQEVLERIRRQSCEPFDQAASVLFADLMDISKCLQQDLVCSSSSLPQELQQHIRPVCQAPVQPKIACFGMEGTFSQTIACHHFPNSEIQHCAYFSDVFDQVVQERADFGVLPIGNSTAGSIHQVYHLLGTHHVYINRMMQMKIDLCLAARPGVALNEIKRAYSHPQPLAQCEQYLSKKRIAGLHCENTAQAAREVAGSSEKAAAICSTQTAKRFGLTVLDENIQDATENYTHFIAISRDIFVAPEQNTISIAFRLPHSVSSLHHLLTKFAVWNVNLLKIESQPVGTKNFDVMFYLDFSGNIQQPNVIRLINSLAEELTDFKFLGCFKGV